MKEKSIEHNGELNISDVEIVYDGVCYDGYGKVKKEPIHLIVKEAMPHKVLVVSKFIPSGLTGLLKLFLPPNTLKSPFRRQQQIIAIIGAMGMIKNLVFSTLKYLILGQHLYRLIVYNCGFCPGLMLASIEPEANKSTTAMIALKAISDPTAFLELNSTAEYIDIYRSSTSLPACLDDLEKDSKQNKMLVGSLNAANKYTVGRGKMEKLCGTIITKNIDPETQKLPAKVCEIKIAKLK